MSDREDIEHARKRIRETVCDHLRTVLGLLGEPVLQSEWDDLKAENARLRVALEAELAILRAKMAPYTAAVYSKTEKVDEYIRGLWHAWSESCARIEAALKAANEKGVAADGAS